MRLFGFEITRTKSVGGATSTMPSSYYSGSWGGWGGWWGGNGWPWSIEEPFTGAWQRNMELRCENVLTYAPVYRCVTIIANDISKLNLRLVEKTDDGIWEEKESSAFSPVLRKQNSHQTRQDFIKRWMLSKLINGNTYVLKERDQRGVVVGMYVLDPFNVYPYVSDDGAVFYQCGGNKLAGIPDSVEVPASEIIHDRNDPLFHDLCGLSPIVSCGLSARQALNSQGTWNRFYANGSAPSGILQVPMHINEEQAELYKNKWAANYGGPNNVGKVAVLGGGLEFKSVPIMSAVDQELIKQLNWTAENVCTAFGVPAYMIGVGPQPPYNNIEALNQQYYSQCLQNHIESIEAKLDEGLGLSGDFPQQMGTEFDLDDLLRMDTKTQYDTYGSGIKNALITTNEGRIKIGLPPKEGGDAIYMQQQYFSQEALAERDAAEPFAQPAAPSPAPSSDNHPANDNQDQEATDEQRSLWLAEGAHVAGT